MGQFSWLYSDTGKQMVDGKYAQSYLLVPKEFQDTYGKAIYENCYDGYGHMGLFDVYDLVALWNRNYITPEMVDGYDSAIGTYNVRAERIKDFVAGTSPEIMRVKYGEDYLRNIGIDIACYDEQNAALKYPIKITTEIYDYDEVEPSNGDPDQGWEMDEEEEEE